MYVVNYIKLNITLHYNLEGDKKNHLEFEKCL